MDQNGYLVGAKQIAQTGSLALRPRRPGGGEIDPLQFIGQMWVGFDLGTDAERYYPKYPAGLPLIYAAALKVGGVSHGVPLVYLVSPIAMTLSLIGVHLLARLFLGSIPAVSITLLVAASPVSLSLVNNPNSHAVTLLLVTWGMYLLVRWWLGGALVWALFSGLLLGAAVSIRYSEGLLVLPMALVALFRLERQHWRHRPTLMGTVALFAGWSIPVGLLFTHNLIAMGTLTGYGPTNESTGFGMQYFVQNWDTMLRLMYQTGMTLVFPMAIGGLAAGFVWNWRVASLLAVWVVPCVLLYTAYYWAPENLNIGYTRFFLTIFPAMGICAFGLLLWPVSHLSSADDATKRRLNAGAVCALTIITAISVPLGIANILQSLKADHATRQNLEARTKAILREVPPHSVLICEDAQLAHHLQFVADYYLYTPGFFARPLLDQLVKRDPTEPTGLDPSRVGYLASLLQDYDQAGLDKLRDDVIAEALEGGHRVFAFSQLPPEPPLAGRDGPPPSPAGGRPAQAAAPDRPVPPPWTRRPTGWRSFDLRRFDLTTVVTGTDPATRPWPERAGVILPVRPRNVRPVANAKWIVQEISFRDK